MTECKRCGEEGKPDHVCPYKADINADYETKCNCCGSCRQDCADDV